MNTIFLGAGIGAILLSILWILALVLCFVSVRTSYNLGPLVVALVVIFSVILLTIPRDIYQESSATPQTKILDPLFVWRTSILLFLGLSTIIGATYIVMSHIMEVKQARFIKSWFSD